MGLSDNGIVLARRKRLAELLVEGKTQAEAGEILKGEGFPADRRTLWKDVCTFETAGPQVDFWRSEQLIELADLKAQLESPFIKADRKIDLALSIIDREMKLLGTEAAKKTVNVNVDANPENLTGYRKFVQETRQLSARAMEQVWDFCRKLTAEESRPAIEAHFPEEDSDETA